MTAPAFDYYLDGLPPAIPSLASATKADAYQQLDWLLSTETDPVRSARFAWAVTLLWRLEERAAAPAREAKVLPMRRPEPREWPKAGRSAWR